MTPRLPLSHRPLAGASPWWLYGFVVVQCVCQAALVIEPLGGLRMAFRATTFASSIAMLVLVPTRGSRVDPLRNVVLLVLGLTLLALLHPGLNTPLAGVAQVAMYVAVFAPVFWVGRVAVTPGVARNVVVLLWAFQTASATLGVLQVYAPAQFAPDPVFVRRMQGVSADGLVVTLDSGQQVWRPFGLTDTPGGAAGSGSFAALGGLAIAATTRNPLLMVAGMGSAAAGMFCIYICQVRSLLFITAIGMIGMIGLTVARGRTGKALGLAGGVVVAVLGGWIWVNTVGSEAVGSRLRSLTDDRPEDVYYESRGRFLELALSEELPAYPLGAGLGRWGMMHAYFGDSANPDAPPLWVEIQPTGWIYDGGLPLLLAGYTAVIVACGLSLRAVLRARTEDFAGHAATVAAFSLGVLASSLGYPVFVSQTGLLFWLLYATLSAATNTQGRP